MMPNNLFVFIVCFVSKEYIIMNKFLKEKNNSKCNSFENI